MSLTTSLPPPPADTPATPPLTGTPLTGALPRTELARKAELEAALQAAPDDGPLRSVYFEHLAKLATSYTGLLTANLPELHAPLYLRCGTPDISVLASVFRDGQLDIPMRATPTRILVIGAYAGYTAVDLARRHPRASVLAAEPQPDSFRLLALNTGAWRRIRIANAALWHSPTRLAALGRIHAEWAVRLSDEALEGARSIPAIPVEELLARAGMDHVNLVLCDASGAEREVFFDPLAPWLRHLDVALVRIHEQAAQGAQLAVTKAFEGDAWERRQHGELEVFARKVPRTALPPGRGEHTLIRAEPGPCRFGLLGVAPYGFAFFVFDGTSCQLHPNTPGSAPPRAIFPVDLDGHDRLVSGVLHAGQPGAHPIVFAIAVERDDGTPLGREEVTVQAQREDEIIVRLPEGVAGPGRVVLETQMAPGAANNHAAWARFIDPKLI